MAEIFFWNVLWIFSVFWHKIPVIFEAKNIQIIEWKIKFSGENLKLYNAIDPFYLLHLHFTEL